MKWFREYEAKKESRQASNLPSPINQYMDRLAKEKSKREEKTAEAALVKRNNKLKERLKKAKERSKTHKQRRKGRTKILETFLGLITMRWETEFHCQCWTRKTLFFYEGNQLTVYRRKFPQTESFFLGQESPKEDIIPS